MKKNLVERVSGGANINSTVDLRQSSRYIIGSLQVNVIIIIIFIIISFLIIIIIILLKKL